MSDPYLSIVIPVYNEEQRISPSLEKILAYLENKSFSREIILVDDGSTDNGVALARQMLDGREPLRVLSYGENRGKGYALKHGMTRSKGRYVLFTDADLATPIEELDKMLPWLEGEPGEYDIVQGSRKMPGAIVEHHQPWLRENMGKVFTALCNLLVGIHISDATCGFKCYRGEVARDIYERQQIYDWSFDAEIIFIARQSGYKIKEVPVRWHDVRGTKVRLLRDTYRSLAGLFRIRMNGWRGYYKTPAPGEKPIVLEDVIGKR